MSGARRNGSAKRDSVDACVGDITSHFGEIDADVEGIVDRMSAIQKHIGRTFQETLGARGLNHGEYRLLLHLATRPHDELASPGELSRALVLSSGAVTNRLDRLEAARLIRRVADPRDRRGVRVELTAAGRAKIEEAVTEQAGREVDALSALSRTDLRTLNRLLRKVLTSLEARAGTRG